jgi:hypothetical protein
MFWELLLPSLLAPKNAPVLAGSGCKLVIGKPREFDSSGFRNHFFELLSNFVSIEFVDVDDIGRKRSVQAEKGRALEACSAVCVRAGALGVFLWPDFILADGTIDRVVTLANQGYEALVLPVPPFKFNTEKKEDEKLVPGRQIVLSSRQLAASILNSVEPELVDEGWHLPGHIRWPPSIVTREDEGFLLHTTSWALLLCDFARLSSETNGIIYAADSSSEVVNRSLLRMYERGTLYVASDFEDIGCLSVTYCLQATCQPLFSSSADGSWLSPDTKYVAKIERLRKAAYDPLLAALYRIPVWLHDRDIAPERRSLVSARSCALADERLQNIPSTEELVTILQHSQHVTSRYFGRWRIPWKFGPQQDHVRLLLERTPTRFLRWIVFLSTESWQYRRPIYRRIKLLLSGDRNSIARISLRLHTVRRTMRMMEISINQKRDTRFSREINSP